MQLEEATPLLVVEGGRTAGHSQNPRLAEAIRLAALGYKVFPCVAGKKDPCIAGGFKNATTDEKQIRQWWSMWPKANVGMPTEGLLVIDIDPLGDDAKRIKNTWPGPERLADLEATVQASTPRGGSHFYFRDAELKYSNTTSQISAGVDTRGKGGYVLVNSSQTEDGSYHWERSPLDVPADQLPMPPQWLVDAWDRRKPAKPAAVNNHSGVIKNHTRNSSLASIAGSLRRVGCTPDEMFEVLKIRNREQCETLLEEDEVRKIADSIGRYAPAEQINREAAWAPDAPQFRLAGRPLGQFMREESTTVPLIETRDGRALLVAGQMCIAAGASKSLKTSIVGGDLALSLATGTSFLGKFIVKAAKRVALLTGESGFDAIRECFRRILTAREHTPAEDFDGLVVEDQLPRVAEPGHLEELTRFVTEGRFDVVICDPAYWMLASEKTEKAAGNVFVMGAQLQKLRQAIPAGVTLILIHHFSKGAAVAGKKSGEPPSLEDMAQAGFAEFARQWMLIGRRTPYDGESGTHELWFNIGGSAGHSGLWGLDVHEGKQSDPGGRKWDVEVLSRSDVEDSKEDSKEVRSAEKESRNYDKARAKVLSFARSTPGGFTLSGLRKIKGVSWETLRDIALELTDEGELVACDVKKGNRSYPGYTTSRDQSRPVAATSRPRPPIRGRDDWSSATERPPVVVDEWAPDPPP